MVEFFPTKISGIIMIIMGIAICVDPNLMWHIRAFKWIWTYNKDSEKAMYLCARIMGSGITFVGFLILLFG